MAGKPTDLTDEEVAHLRAHNNILAVKAVRERLGLGLKEAMFLVRAHPECRWNDGTRNIPTEITAAVLEVERSLSRLQETLRIGADYVPATKVLWADVDWLNRLVRRPG